MVYQLKEEKRSEWYVVCSPFYVGVRFYWFVKGAAGAFSRAKVYLRSHPSFQSHSPQYSTNTIFIRRSLIRSFCCHSKPRNAHKNGENPKCKRVFSKILLQWNFMFHFYSSLLCVAAWLLVCVVLHQPHLHDRARYLHLLRLSLRLPHIQPRK